MNQKIPATPLEKLITSWLTDPPKEKNRLIHLGRQLWNAVAEDHLIKSRNGIITSPTQDPKVKWAEMFLDNLRDSREKICPHIEACARFSLDLPIPPTPEVQTPRCGKSAAAHDV